MPGQYHPLTTKGKFNGTIRIHPERLDIPLKRKKPTVYAIWNDLFHEDVPDNFIFRALGTMHSAKKHIFLILTKRPKRMLELIERYRHEWLKGFESAWPREYQHLVLGVTVCNQEEADQKIPLLLQIPAAVIWVSHEPGLGMITYPKEFLARGKRAWSVTGGESGLGARPMHPNIPRHDRDQCQVAGVPFLFKHWGEWAPRKHHGINDEGKYPWGTLDQYAEFFPKTTPWNGRDDIKAWDGLHEAVMIRIGRKAAGRLLDGREWNELPEVHK